MEKLEEAKEYVLGSTLNKDKKNFIIKYIDDYSKYRTSIPADKLAEKDRYALQTILGAISGYENEINAGKLSTIINGAFNLTVQDIGKIASDVKSTVSFFTNPITLVILIIVIGGLLLWFKVLKS